MHRIPRFALGALSLSLLGLVPGSAAWSQSCGFDSSRAPASGVPSSRWGDLRPVDTGTLPASRDNTDFDEFKNLPGIDQPFWMSLDVENGWIFAAINHGLEIWDARTSPAAPTRTSVRGGSSFFLRWPSDPHEGHPVRDVDAPTGSDDVVGMALAGGAGVAIVDTAVKGTPVAKYADGSKIAVDVYAAPIAGSRYLFAGTADAGLRVYDLDAARARSSSCSEVTPSSKCGVYVGAVGSRSQVKTIDGVANAAGNRHWIALGSGGAATGFQIFDVSNPAAPSLALSSNDPLFVYGVAMWRQAGSYYLALRGYRDNTTTEARIYDVSCLAGGGCASLGSPRWTKAMPADTGELFVTHSYGAGRDILYFGNFNGCSATPQNEWLFDVSSPAAPVDLTPPTVSGLGYWGWYYRANSTGFNFVKPRIGKFHGDYFYRAAYSIFDIHRWTPARSPSIGGVAVDVASALPCQPVTFTAQDVDGNPVPTLSWEVLDEDEIPVGSGGNVNPLRWTVPVTTPPGTYSALAEATNGLGTAVAESPGLVVTSLPTLAFTGPEARPTVDPYGGNTVQLHVATAGATEWSWDFGDGVSSGWVSDPITGPNPAHSYAAIGAYDVSVSIRNCRDATIESLPLTLVIESLGPATISRFEADGCPAWGCFFVAGTDLGLLLEVDGQPLYYDYDWDGDGAYDVTSLIPLSSHVYEAPATYLPVARVRSVTGESSRVIARQLFIEQNTALPSPPASPSVGFGDGSGLRVAWSDSVVGESAFEVEHSWGGILREIVSTPAGTTELLFFDPVSGVAHTFRVRTVKNGYRSAWSTAVSMAPALFADGFEGGDLSLWGVDTGP